MVTIKDVAKKVGVSTAAVSYALNGKEGLANEKRKEILDAAQSMGYIPNQQARSLVNKKSAIVGIIVSDVTTAYNSEIVKYLERYAHNIEKQVMLGCSSGDITKERFLFERFIAQKMDGIIIFPTKQTDKEQLLTYANIINKCSADILIVAPRVENLRCKFFDTEIEDGMSKIVRYLKRDRGYKNVILISTTEKNIYNSRKEAGFAGAFRALDEDWTDSIYRFEPEDNFEAAKRSIQTFLKTNPLPDAIMAINDISALAMVRQLTEMGYNVPGDVCVTGFDGIDFSDYSDLKITTAGFDRKNLSKRCMNMLFQEEQTYETVGLELIMGNTTR